MIGRPWNAEPPVAPLTPLASALTCVAGGVMLSWAFPEHGWWPAVFPALALILWSCRGQAPGRASLNGALAGFSFYFVHIQWASLFLGPIPMLALTLVMTGWWAIGHALIAFSYRTLADHPGRGVGLLPLAVAGWWTLREAISSTWPYGGFAWGRVAQSQSDSPFTPIVSWLGLSGTSFVLVWAVAFSLELLLRIPRAPQLDSRPTQIAGAAFRITAVPAVFSILAMVPLYPTADAGSLRVLAVQGSTPGASYFIPSEPGEILEAHLDQTRTVVPGQGIGLILWPEGSVDVSPEYSRAAARELDALTNEYGAPLLANTVTRNGDFNDPETKYWNTQFLWRSGEGIVAGYDKAHPVPFGEYVPDRGFFMSIAPDLVGMIGREYTPGTRSNVLELDSGARVGVFICFDIVDDQLVANAINGGAQLLLAPTNNADFGETAELPQQLSFARLRAVETGRSIVQVSTVGDSAAYGPGGEALAALPSYQPGTILVDAPLRNGVTPAIAFGRVIEWFGAGLGIALSTPYWQSRRRTRGAN